MKYFPTNAASASRRFSYPRRALALLMTLSLLLLFFLSPPVLAEEEMDLRDEVLRLVNDERAKAGLNPLALHDSLNGTAAIRAAESAEIFSHVRPDGALWSTVFGDGDQDSIQRGENRAYGQKTPEKLVEALLASEGQRKNLLSDTFTQAGIGYVQIRGIPYWSMHFSSGEATPSGDVPTAK